MDDRRSFEDDTAAKQRLTGEPSFRQVIVLVVITSVIMSFSAAMLRLTPVATFVVIVVGMVVLGLVGRLILKRINLRRHR
ncbi:hypothetical protein [Clavibacter sp. CT19]|uniref:hypothetical protein n=1 Tax=unclassified Clavibacter TaxID=2626594 RepID=UPI0022EB989D|nr:hypothetical protein [Clavibacter sp. CT19]MDA3804832.1 hypothetical protein [Clavibacter sp. CT19]